MTTSKGTSKRTPKQMVTLPDGSRVSFAALASRNNVPLVAYSLNCNHVGKAYAVQKRDIIFCEKCGMDRRVTKIIAS